MHRLYPLSIVAALVLATLLPARADEVTDAIQAATEAYGAGDLKGATDQLAMASAAVLAKQVAVLNTFLPPAPDGWTSEINADYAKGFAMLGGGSGTEATYSSDSGSFTLDITADNPLVASMAPMLASVPMMSSMGKAVKIGDVMVLEQDDEKSLMALIDNRIMVQMAGGDMAVMLPLFQSIDFAGLAKAGQN